jgi:hypothetical protein
MTKRSHWGEFGLMRVDCRLPSIPVAGVRVADGHQVGRRRLPCGRLAIWSCSDTKGIHRA